MWEKIKEMFFYGSDPTAMGAPMNVEISLSTWIISDTHFFQLEAEQLFHRPSAWQNLLIQNWQRQVRADEMVLHLGDLSLGIMDDLAALIPFLPGRMILVRGNHDKFPAEHYSQLGIVLVEGSLDTLITDSTGKAHWLRFSHEPEPPMRGLLNLHGHIHNLPHITTNQPGYINCSIEVMEYRLWRLSEILADKV